MSDLHAAAGDLASGNFIGAINEVGAASLVGHGTLAGLGTHDVVAGQDLTGFDLSMLGHGLLFLPPLDLPPLDLFGLPM